MHRGGAQLRFAWRRTSYRLSVLGSWPHRGFGPRPTAEPWLDRVRKTAPRRVAPCTALRSSRPWADRARDRGETGRYLARAGRAEGTSKAWLLRQPSQIAATPSPEAETRDDGVCHQIERVAGDDLAK